MLNSVIGRVMKAKTALRNSISVLFSSKNLLVTNIGISVGLSSLGDVLQQHYSLSRGERWDRTRTAHMATTGASIGYCCHHWYNYLDDVLPGRSAKALFKKIVVDQALFSPFLIFVFFGTIGILERQTFSEVLDESFEKGKRLYAAEWCIWPPAQFVNFYFVPTRFRVLYDSTISLGFDIYTSYVKYGSEAHSRSPTGFELVAEKSEVAFE